MGKQLLVSECYGTKVFDAAKGKKVGKIRNVLFHPKAKRVIGFSVKRPDILLMAHRKDFYFSIYDYEIDEGKYFVSQFRSHKQSLPQKTQKETKESKALAKGEKITWDNCIIWYGLSVLSENGDEIGRVGDILFEGETGAVEELHLSQSMSSDTLLGTVTIPASQILGFKKGVGSPLLGSDGTEIGLGALIVTNEAANYRLQDMEGGLAEKAGTAAAVVGEKVTDTVSTSIKPTVDKAAEKASEIAHEASTKGAYKIGEQLGKSTGMFSSFVDEFKKANKD